MTSSAPHILVFAEYIRSMPWSMSIWAAHIARALSESGATVTVAADGIEDPAVIAPPTALLVRRPLRKLRASDPIRFARWCASIQSSHPSASTISFTRYHPARLWIPLAEPVLSTLAHAALAHRPATAAMELLHRPWALKALIAERRAAASAREALHMRAALGGHRAVDSARPPTDASPLGLASILPPIAPPARLALRARTRRLLSIPPDAICFLTSAVHHDRASLQDLLDGFSAAIASSQELASARLLILGRKTHTIASRIERASLTSRASILGGTSRMDAAFAAADVALVASSPRDRNSSGRFLADSLSQGVPVITPPSAAGSALLRDPSRTSASAGLVLADGTSTSWRDAIRTAASPHWRTIAAHRAAEIGATLTLPLLAARILALLDRSPTRPDPARVASHPDPS